MNQKIRIAFFAEMLIEDYDGAIRTMYHIIRRIPKDKYEVIFYCGVPPKNDIGFQVFSVPSITIPFNRSYKIALHQLSKNRLADHLDYFNPDIIHTSSPSPMGQFAVNYAKRNHIPITTIYHTHFPGYIEYYLRDLPLLIKPVKNAMLKSYDQFYNNCDKVLVPTTEIVNELIDYGVDPARMKIWPRGLDRNIFNPTKKESIYLKSITGNDNFNVLFASRLVWEKNLNSLINVYKAAEEQGLKWNFIIAGEGVAMNTLQKKMPNAFFLGKLNQNELAKVYASSDVFLFPSDSETYGNVVVEAMSCGLPCVIANGGGSRSFIDHGENGFLCTPNKVEEYVESIKALQNSSALRVSFALKGLHFVAGLDWDHVIHRLFEEWNKTKENLLLVD